MNCVHKAITCGLAVLCASAALLSPLQPALAGPKQTQQEATAASLATGALLYNYARHQNSRNGAYVLGAGAGTAYLWSKYSHQRQAEKRQERARLNYYRRRASYYHKVARYEHRRSSSPRKVYPHRRSR